MPGHRRRGLRVADSSIFPQITNGNSTPRRSWSAKRHRIIFLARRRCLRPIRNPGSTRLGNQPALTHYPAQTGPKKRQGSPFMRAQPKASHYIGGAYTESQSGTPFDSLYPGTGEVIAQIHPADDAIIAAAISAAKLKVRRSGRQRLPPNAAASSAGQPRSCGKKTMSSRFWRLWTPANRCRKP
jgi:hypothetical protein